MSQNEIKPCTGCQGSGKCYRCNGVGNVLERKPVPITVFSGQVGGSGETWRMCPHCYGSGMCPICKGKGSANLH